MKSKPPKPPPATPPKTAHDLFQRGALTLDQSFSEAVMNLFFTRDTRNARYLSHGYVMDHAVDAINEFFPAGKGPFYVLTNANVVRATRNERDELTLTFSTHKSTR